MNLRTPIDLYIRALKLPLDAVNGLLGRNRDPRAEAAEQIRTEAAERGQERKQQAEQRRKETVQRARRTETQRKQTNAKTTAKVEEVIDENARRARLAALEEKSDALDAEEKALKAKQNAKGLEKAAATVKAAR